MPPNKYVYSFSLIRVLWGMNSFLFFLIGKQTEAQKS